MLNLFRYLFVCMMLLSAGAVMAADIHRELEDIAKRLAAKIEETKRTNVAIADFTDLRGAVHELGRFISEEVSTNMVLSASGFSVIDRNHLRTILKEQKLSMSGLMDPENQKKLGKILGVDALVLGSITPFGESYRITFKVVATDTARVITADRGTVPKTPATDELWSTIFPDDIGGSGQVQALSPRSQPIATTGAVFKAGNVSFRVEKVIPFENGQYRVVGTVVNASDKPLKAMLLAPTQLIGLLGNVADFASSTGILPCWTGGISKDAKGCAKQQGDFTVLLPRTPQRFAIIFHARNKGQGLNAQVQLQGTILIKADKPVVYTINFPALKVSKP